MQQASDPIVTDLVLIGGGHSHAIALQLLGMNPLPGVCTTLISDVTYTPYSGMLPGQVAGFYSYDETHIDLRRLARFAGAQFYRDRAVRLDLERDRVICANRPPVAFDCLSIDIGSTPAIAAIPGVAEYATPAKPVPQFLRAWESVIQAVEKAPHQPLSLGIVGGGAGGVELAVNMQRNLHQRFRNAGQPPENLHIHLFHRGRALLPNHNRWVSRRLRQILRQRGVGLHLGESVSRVTAEYIVCESGLRVRCDLVFWVTQASAPPWVKQSDLSTDSDGFILVRETLQSVSHPRIFATGDIATMENYQRPKAGVFAVRQGKPLFENLRHFLFGEPLQLYRPQKRYLGLIGTGDRSAIASWSFLGWQSPFLWQWKDYIDRKFMRRFSEFPEMVALPPLSRVKFPSQSSPLYCAGCGSKVGSSTLKRVLERLNLTENPEILIGLDSPDDAAVVRVPRVPSGRQSHRLLAHTIDYFTSLINDPFLFGQIVTNHCLSDLFAMGAMPQSVLAAVTIPHGSESKQEEILYQLLSGVVRVLQQCHTPLVGGHTTEGSELAVGLACNGLVCEDRILRKSGMKPSEVLILTKALGTGTLFAAEMRSKAQGRWIDGAVESMLLSNQMAAQLFLEWGATACTDVTGFGLVGHLLEMVRASQVGVELDLDAIPALEGAIEMISQEITSSLHSQNFQFSARIRNSPRGQNSPSYQLLFDPQTAGGLLAAVPADRAKDCLKALHSSGYLDSQIIGCVVPADNGCADLTVGDRPIGFA